MHVFMYVFAQHVLNVHVCQCGHALCVSMCVHLCLNVQHTCVCVHVCVCVCVCVLTMVYAIDNICRRWGMTISATKTKILAVG